MSASISAAMRRQARLRVAHRRRAVAVDRAEVALAVDERVAHREVLGEPDEGVVEGDVAVRVVLAHHLADDRGALAVRAGRRQPHLAHRVEDPAMDGLEAVADVGQGARHDDAHRVVEVRDAHLVLDADGADVAQVVGHGRLLLRRGHVVRRAGVRDGGGVRAARRSARRSRRRRRSDGAPGRWRMPGERVAQVVGDAGSSLARVSRMTQARWPSSVAAARSASRRRARVVRRRSTRASERYAQDSAFWTSGSASPMSWPRSGRACSATSGSRPRAPIDRGSSSRSSSRRGGAPSATASRRAARARPSGRARRRCPCRTGGPGRRP